MRIKVVTNNPKLDAYAKAEGFDTEFLDQPQKAVMHYARDLVLAGWHLVTDPLMGYKHRPNPFHTVILHEGEPDETLGDAVLRLEQCVVVLEEKGRPQDLEEPSRSGYLELDFSLAQNALEAALQYYEK